MKALHHRGLMLWAGMCCVALVCPGLIAPALRIIATDGFLVRPHEAVDAV